MSSEPQVVGSIATGFAKLGPVKWLIVVSAYSGTNARTPSIWSGGRDGLRISANVRQLFESVRESTSSALEYVKKLVLVFVEELPGFEFFMQHSRVYIAVPNLEEQFFDSQTGVHWHTIANFHAA